ncbi:DUF4097 family beta strand repeat-containing protein [Microbacterium sp. P01]|uniref:DUF4097 family beta strand repeat-containing protein n=1 Tax=Microbacterium sp. P01 TaxID=3366261 RepID=UPI00366B1138
MSTPTMTPPTPPTSPTPPPLGSVPGDRPAHSAPASRVIAIMVISLGVVVALFVAGSAIVSTVASGSVRTETRTVAVNGIDDLDVDISAGSVRVRYGEVDGATLQVTGSTGAGAWTFERDEDTLQVSSPDSAFGFGWGIGGNGEAVLTLPAALRRAALDGDFRLAAGELDLEGDFGELDLEVGAGSLSVEGSARTLTIDLSAGRADLDLSGVTTADFTVNAGAVEANLAGDPPRTVTIDVSAGGLELTMPDAPYDVRATDTTAGDLTNELETSSGARNTIDVRVSAGSVELLPAG